MSPELLEDAAAASPAQYGPLSTAKGAAAPVCLAAPGEDPENPPDCVIPPSTMVGDCGPFGVLCAAPPGEEPSQEPQVCVPFTGFNDLGGEGDEGKIVGPTGSGQRGDGTFETTVNSQNQLSVKLRTGYMRITLTLVRNAGEEGCRDEISIVGDLWEDGRWNAVDGRNPVKVTYDPDDDEGLISWREKGKKKSEGFWYGKDGNGQMTLEFGGGYNHDFYLKSR